MFRERGQRGGAPTSQYSGGVGGEGMLPIFMESEARDRVGVLHGFLYSASLVVDGIQPTMLYSLEDGLVPACLHSGGPCLDGMLPT